MTRLMQVETDEHIVEVLVEVIDGLMAGTTKIRSMEITHGFEHPKAHLLHIDLHAFVTHDKENDG